MSRCPSQSSTLTATLGSDICMVNSDIPHPMSPASFINVDADIDDGPDVPNAMAPALHPCEGLKLEFPPGKTPSSTYPFALHDTKLATWDYKVRNGQMTLFARTCQQMMKDGLEAATMCEKCHDLEENPTLQGVVRRIQQGVHENSPFAYHGHAGMAEINRRKSRQIDAMRLRALNTNRQLMGKEGALDEYKKFVVAIGDGG